MRIDQSQVLSPGFLIPPATLSADNTPATLNLTGFQSTTVQLLIGIGGITFTGTNRIDFVLTHSFDDSTYVNVTDADLIGVTGVTNGIVRSLIAAHAAPSITEIGYIGGRPFLRCLADFGGTHATGTPICVLGIRGNPLTAPVA